MANNNRNSSSSSFSSSSGGSNKNGAFKSNSQSTFDMFNINVRDAQKKVTSVFDFTKGKIKENEKTSTKSITKIFDTLDSRIKNSAGVMENAFTKMFNNLNKLATAHADIYSKSMDQSVNKMISNTQNKYKTMYQNLDKQHENYVRKIQSREKNSGTTSTTSSTTNSVSNLGSSNSGNSNNSLNIDGIANKLSQANDTQFGKSMSKAEQYIDRKMKSGDMTAEQGQKLFDQYSTSSNAARKHAIASEGLKVGSAVIKPLINVIGKFIGMWTDGAQKFSQQYEANYNQLATAFNSDRTGIHEMLDKGMNDLGDKVGNLVNYSDEFLPALADVSRQGLMGDNALAKAIRDSIDKKIMPWLDTASEQWVNMNTYLSENNLNTLKGQQLMMQNTQNGNRLLQSGVINSLTSDIEPLLRDIDFNTAGEMTGEAGKIMESLMNQGFTEREAYDYTKQLTDVKKDLYGAFTNGDASEIIAAGVFANGGGYEDVFKELNSTVTPIAASGNSDITTSASVHALGKLTMAGDTYTAGRADAMLKAGEDKSLNNTSLAGSGTDDWIKTYEKAEKESSEKITTTQEALNGIENSAAETLGLWSTQIPLFWTWAGSVLSALTGIGQWAMDKLFSKLFDGGFKNLGTNIKNMATSVKNFGSKAISGIKNAGSKLASGAKNIGSKALGGLKSIAPKILTGLGKGGITAGGASTATAVAAGATGLIAGGIMMGKDAAAGVKKSKEWLGSNKTGDKVAAGIGGAIGGTGPGIGEKGASAKDVAKNTGKNALKGAAIGAGIGSFIPGVGTVIGGAIGAGVGALTGLIGGKRIAKAAKAIGGAFKKAGKAVGGALKKGAKAVGGFLKKTSVGKAIGDVAKVWKDDSKSFGEKLGGSVKALVKNNPLAKVGKAVGGALKKGIKSLGKAVKNSKIGKAVSGAINKVKESTVGKAVTKGIDKVKGGAKKVWSTIKGWFASGSDEIPYDGYVAKLHKGETVFNAKATKSIKKVLGITGKSVGESPLLAKLDAIKQKLSNKASDIFGKVKKTKAGGKLFDIFKGVAGKITGSFASGVDNAPEGNAVLHKGEMVVSRPTAKAIKSVIGVTGKSVDSPLSIIDRLFDDKLFKKKDKKGKSDNADVVRAIEKSTEKIVKAILEDSSASTSVMSKLQGAISKVKVSYNDSVVNMEPISGG